MAEHFWINEQIAVSGAIADKELPLLKKAGIDAILEIRSEYCDNTELIEKCGMQFLHIDVDDRCSPGREQLQAVITFADGLLDDGKKILIHCQNGCGRAPLTAVAILAKRGMGIPEALNLVQERLPWTGFSETQRKFIHTELDKFLTSGGA